MGSKPPFGVAAFNFKPQVGKFGGLIGGPNGNRTRVPDVRVQRYKDGADLVGVDHLLETLPAGSPLGR